MKLVGSYTFLGKSTYDGLNIFFGVVAYSMLSSSAARTHRQSKTLYTQILNTEHTKYKYGDSGEHRRLPGRRVRTETDACLSRAKVDGATDGCKRTPHSSPTTTVVPSKARTVVPARTCSAEGGYRKSAAENNPSTNVLSDKMDSVGKTCIPPR